MDIQTISRILDHSWLPEYNEYKLVLGQHFDTSHLTFLVTMRISEEISHRLRSMLHLYDEEKLVGHNVSCLVEGTKAFTVKFELGGCFPVETTEKGFPNTAIISRTEPKKASGLATLFLYNPAKPNGNYFFEEYFLSEKYYNDLEESLYNNGSSVLCGHEVSIDEMGRCYCKVTLPATSISAEAIFMDVPMDVPTAVPPTLEEFFSGK